MSMIVIIMGRYGFIFSMVFCILFLGFCLISGTGYLANQTADAVKEVAVERENKKSELNLRKNLGCFKLKRF